MPDFAVARLGPCRFESPLHANVFVDDGSGILVDASLAGYVKAGGAPPAYMEAAGPRRLLHVDPRKTRAAIVTCGGLCPGLNDVIRALTMVLWYRYGVWTILGLRYGRACWTTRGSRSEGNGRWGMVDG